MTNTHMQKIEFFGLDIPPEYPIESHVAYVENAKIIIASNKEAWVEFLRGIKATAYRFIAFKELTEEMNLKWEALELFPSHRDIFEQERDLLYLFVNGVSAIESVYYSLYILATQANPKVLQFSDLENRKYGSDPRWIRKNLAQALGTVSVLTSIKSIERSENWKVWNKYRNMMFHSVAAPRVHRLSVSPNPPKPAILDYGSTWCTPDLIKDSQGFREYLPWLSSKLGRLLRDGATIEKVA